MTAKKPARKPRKAAPGYVDGRTVRSSLTREERAARNELIMNYFLAGRTQQWIAQHPKVQLRQETVWGIIHTELQNMAKRQGLLTPDALTIYVGRLEMLIGQAFPRALQGDPKMIEVGRRLLEQYARLYDLAPEQRSAVMLPPMSDDELQLLDENSPAFQALDDLTKYRLRQHKAARS